MNPTIKLGQEYGLNITACKPGEKGPFIGSWQTKYLSDKLIKYYDERGYNLGFVCGPTKNEKWIIVIDFDNKEAFNHVKSKIPPTLVINTGLKGDWRGKQVYFMCDDPVDNEDFDFGNKEVLSIRGKGRFVVGPGSLHPSGVRYEIALDKQISVVGKDFFRALMDEVKSFFGDNNSAVDIKPDNKEFRFASPLYCLTYKDIFPNIDDSGVNIEHPLHGSETGHNFKIDENGLGHCFRHNVTLAAWQMLAVKADICKCADAGNGFKGGSKSALVENEDVLSRLWEYAVNERYVKVGDQLPTKIRRKNAPEREDIFIHTYDKNDEIKNTKILTGVLGNYVGHQYVFKTLTDTEEVFVYANGVYVPGETLIKSECQKILGEKIIKTNYVKEAIDFIRRDTFEDRDSFDMDDKLINLKNGLYDIENNKLIEHTPNYLSFIQMPIEYDPSAVAPVWSKYLGNTLALNEDRMILQEVAGWVFMGGYNIQKAVLLEGGGGNGKSVYLDTITAMLGADNVSSVSWQELGEDKYAKAQLYGKMANIHTDLSKSAITDTSAFKALTGGDKIWSDVKHSIKGINFYNRAKLVYACNQIPRSKDITDAFFDRLILINFPFKIRGTKNEDKNLKKKLIEELPGIFNWAIVGLNRLLETEAFSTSKTTDDFKSIYQKKSDTVVAFFHELVRRGEKEDKETKEDVYQYYVAYCREHLNIEPVNKQVFGAAFGKQAGWIGSGQRYVFVEKGEDSIRLSCWTNIKIKDLPGKQDTIPWTGEGIVSEKSTSKKPSNTTHTIPKTPFSPTENIDSPDNPIFNKEKDKKEIISDKKRRKGIVCVDKVTQKERCKTLFGMIKSRQKIFNDSVVYKSELADEYQLKKWSEAQLNQDLQTLMKDGQIYDPNRNERYKVV